MALATQNPQDPSALARAETDLEGLRYLELPEDLKISRQDPKTSRSVDSGTNRETVGGADDSAPPTDTVY